jgi:protein SCO1/2
MLRLGTQLRRSTTNFGRSRFLSKLEEGKDSRTRGPVTFFSLGLAVVTAGGIVAFYNIEKDRKTKALAKNVKSVGKPALGGPWVLVDQDGIPRTDASYRGNFAILYFGFTYCPDICPSELVKVGNIIKLLGRFHQLYRILIVPIQTSRQFSLTPRSLNRKEED